MSKRIGALSTYLLISLSLILNLAFVAVAGYWTLMRGGIQHVSAKAIIGVKPMDYSQARRELYRKADRLELGKRPIVMFGDSLTGGGLWEEWFGPSVLNRGIGGESTREALARATDVADLQPARVFVMLASNDYQKVPVEETRRNISAIIRTIHDRSPRSEVYVESLLPAPSREQERWTRVVNASLQSVASEEHARWIDLAPAFADGDLMREGLTVDGTHLNAKGYELWQRALAPYVLGPATRL